MNDLKNRLKRYFINITLVFSFILFLCLFIYFILNVHQLERTQKVIGILTDIVSVFGFSGLLSKRIKKHRTGDESFLEGLKKSMHKNFSIIGYIWIFILFMAIVFSYILPVHTLTAEIGEKGSPKVIDPKSIQVAAIVKNNTVYPMDQKIEGKTIYKTTPQSLTWNESIKVRVSAEGYQDYEESVLWSAFAFLTFFRGLQWKVALLPLKPIQITLSRVEPTSARVDIESQVDTSFMGAGIFRTPKNTSVRIRVSHEDYYPEDTTFIAQEDIELTFDLNKKPGQIVFLAFDEGGTEIRDMDVYSMTTKIGKTGRPISLPSGTYWIHLSKTIPEENARAITDPLYVTVRPGETDTVRFEGVELTPIE